MKSAFDNPMHWMELTTQYLDLDNGCFITIEDDPNLGGSYLATVHFDDGEYIVIESTRGEIEDKREATAWAFSMFDKLRALISNNKGNE